MILDQVAGPHPVIITPPSALAKTASTTTTISLGWTNGSSTAIVEVWRDSVLIASLAAATVAYTDTGRTSGIVYAYQIRHTAAGGAYSPFTPAGTFYTALPIPNTPTLSGDSDLVSSVIFNWVNTTNLLQVKVFRGGVLISTQAAATTSYNDTGLSPGTYVYTLAYTFGADTGTQSGSLSEAVTGTVLAPTGLALTPVSASEIDLTWANATAGTVINVCRGTVVNPTTVVHTTGTDATSYSDTGLVADTVYHYRLTCTKLGVTSGFSADVSTTSLVTPPSALAVTTPNTDRATLTWTNGDAAATVEVWKNGVLLTTLAAATTTYNDDAVTTGDAPSYKLRHNKSGILSVYSSAVSVTLPALSLTSESLTCTVGTVVATMAWTATKVPHDATYELTSWTDGDGDGSTVAVAITTPHDIALGFTITVKNPGITHQVFISTVFKVKNQAAVVKLTDTTTFAAAPYKAN